MALTRLITTSGALVALSAALAACGDSADDAGPGAGGAGASSAGGAGAAGAAGGSGGSGGSSGGAGGAQGGQGGGGQGGGGQGGLGGGQGGLSGSGGLGGLGGGGQGGLGGGGGQGGGCATPIGPPPVLSAVGQADRILLQGHVVTPTATFDGEVLVVGDTIACVAATCAGLPEAANASIVQTHGVIFPGLIDSHNHILFNIFDETDWAPQQAYQHHDQWPNEPRYAAMLDAKQYLNGESGSPVNVNCEMNKYGELKGLVAGTTSILGAANPINKICYGSLARTIDQSSNGLGQDKIQVATIFPNTTAANNVCANFANDVTDAFVIHIAEGTNQSAKDEFQDLIEITTVDGCLIDPRTTIVHGTALDGTEFGQMAAAGMSLVWSPRSNVALYGAGVDFTKTTDIPLARSLGINVALAPDWSMGGSQNLLDELRFANLLDDTQWGDVLSPQDLFEMVSVNAAAALGLSGVIGSLEVGAKADIMVISGSGADPYGSLLLATPADVRLVMVGGVPLYGEPVLEPLAPANPGCEVFDACCIEKFVCVALPQTNNFLNQTLAQIETNLSIELAAYDDLDLTQWDFSPLTPIVRCD